MARYNSVNATGSIAGGNSIATPASGLLTTLTGTGTVTLPNPVLYTGSTQTFYNSTGSAITLSSSPAFIVGPGIAGSSTTVSLAGGAVITLVSDGANYIAQDWLGGVVVTTSLTATSGSINNTTIGATTASTGAFTTLSAGSTTTLAGGSASGVFSFTSAQASSATNNGAIVVTGGAGIGGAVYAGNGIYVTKAYSGVGAGNPLATFYGTDSGIGNTGISITTKGASTLGSATDSYPLQVLVNGSVTAVFRGDGNVGIGTANPSAKLHITGVSGGGYSTSNKLILQRTDATNPTGSIEFQGSGGHASPYWNILTDADITNDWGIAYNGTKLFQILTGGNVGIGTSNPSSYTLQVAGTIGATGNIYSSTSDIRLKDIVRPIINAVDIIKSIETFYYRNNKLALSLGLKDTELQVGISAQSALVNMPEVTAPAPLDPKYLTVMYERIVPFLIEAVKDQQKNIESLQEQINYLQGKQ